MFCQAAVPSFSTKLSCQWAEMKDKWLQNRQKWRKNREIWQKPTKSGRNQTKNDRKSCKMRSFTNNLLPSFPFLSCQAPISVLPHSLFCRCPAKLINFSRGGAQARPPKIRLWLVVRMSIVNTMSVSASVCGDMSHGKPGAASGAQ